MEVTTLQCLLPELMYTIFNHLTTKEVSSLGTTSIWFCRLVSTLESRPDYWIQRNGLLARSHQIFWLTILQSPPTLPVAAWKELYYLDPDYAVGKWLSPEVVFTYTDFLDGRSRYVDSELVKGIICSDRASLLEDWINRYRHCPSHSDRQTLFEHTLTSHGGWNLMVANVRDEVSNNRMRSFEFEEMVLLAAQSKDIAHYMFVSKVTGIYHAIPELLETVIIHSPDNLGYYLRYVPGARKAFQTEVIRLQQNYWTYHYDYTQALANYHPTVSYRRLLRKVIRHSSDMELEEMLRESKVDDNYSFVLLLVTLREDPRVNDQLLARTVVQKIVDDPHFILEVFKVLFTAIGVDISAYIRAGILTYLPKGHAHIAVWILNRKRAPPNHLKYWEAAVGVSFVNIACPIYDDPPETEVYSPEDVKAITTSLLSRITDPFIRQHLAYKLENGPRLLPQQERKVRRVISVD
jgi:hypothetical protein